MSTLSAQQLAERAVDVNLLNDRQLQEIWGALGSRNVSAAEFTQALLRREMLTSYQLARLERGDRNGFFYGDYCVLYLVGTGSFGRVYRASHRHTGQIVALKVLRRRHSNPEQRDQFLREGQLGASLRHPNIVPIFEVGSEGNTLYFVMEFIEGRNLREFVKMRKCCAPAEALRLMSDVARGLDYALQQGVGHRDIKLSNVLVSSRGEAKLLDFGLASDKALSDEALANCGNARTVDYAGLERACGVRRDDPRSDLYFVGCMLYHMVSGQAPLSESRDQMQRLSKTRFLSILPVEKVNPDLPRPLVNIVNKATQLDAVARYQTPRELLADLENAYGRLGEMDTMLEEEGRDAEAAVGDSQVPQAAPAQALRPVMFVESNPEVQDIFRKRLKRAGYRVLVTSDPQRALERFRDREQPAACVVFCAADLGERALTAYDKFVHAPETRQIPAVLLLGKDQGEWSERSTRQDHHVVLTMPITLGKLREILDRLTTRENLEQC